MTDGRAPDDGSHQGQGGRPPRQPPWQGAAPGWGPPGPPQGPPPGWGPPQGPPPGWGQQGPPPGWMPPQPPQQGWGPPPGPGWQPPGGPPPPPSGNGRTLAIVVGASVVAVALLVTAVVLGVTQLGDGDGSASDDRGSSASGGGSDDPDVPGSDDGPLSTSSAEATRSRLGERGWTCYDSLERPVVKRCFSTRPGTAEYASPVQGEVRFGYEDGALTTVRLAVTGSSGEPQTGPLVAETATLVGDTLLDGRGTELAEIAASESTGRTDLGRGVRASGSGTGFSLSTDDATYEQVESDPLPSTQDVQTVLSTRGFTCGLQEIRFMCTGVVGRVEVQLLTTQTASGPTSWSVSARTASYGDDKATVREGLEATSRTLLDAGLTDEAGAAFVAKDAPSGARGDFDGHEVRVIRTESGEVFSLLVTVRPIF